MAKKIREYRGDDMIVTYDTKRCIHAAECIRRMPEVFDTKKRPWVQAEGANNDALAAVVEHCPTGALHHIRSDGGAAEQKPQKNTIFPKVNGALYLQGNLKISTPDGETHYDTRVALCRCGVSKNKPFCDNAHHGIKFRTDLRTAYKQGETEDSVAGSELEITIYENSSIGIKGDFEIVDIEGETLFRGKNTFLCRCGASQNKPFCDDSHKTIGFTTTPSLEGEQ